MPRKPRPPMMMRIEGLSTGIDPTLVDEWDGSLIAQPNAKPPEDEFAKRDARRMQAVKDKLTMLQVLGIVERPEHMKPEPEPTHAEVRLGNYIARIPLPPKKPFRRF